MRNHAAGKRLIIPFYDSSEFFADTADYAIIDLNVTTIEHIKCTGSRLLPSGIREEVCVE